MSSIVVVRDSFGCRNAILLHNLAVQVILSRADLVLQTCIPFTRDRVDSAIGYGAGF